MMQDKSTTLHPPAPLSIPLLPAANQLSREAERLKAEAEELGAGRQELMQAVEVQLEETSQLVERGREQQQITAELLADTFTAEGQAKDAIKTAEKTLSEAKETLSILEGKHGSPHCWRRQGGREGQVNRDI